MAKPEQQIVEGLTDPTRRREYLWRRWTALKSERSSWDAHAKDLAQNLLPRASRFTTAETNQGGGKHNKIYDNTALRAVRILAAGMMSGLTSPARPWFRLKHEDDALMEYEPVKVWCSLVTRMILTAFAKSNTYRVLHQGYGELGVFGTHAALIMPDFDSVIHGTSLTWGEYALATNGKGQVDTLYREMRMSAGAMADQFGIEALSPAAKRAFHSGSLDQTFDVVHAIEPNREHDPRFLDPRNMPFKSCYFEQGAEKGTYLRESGFRRFRALAPRWLVTGNDTYGESPGMEALGDAKQLQHEQYRKAQGIDYMTKPPIGLPTATKGMEIDTLPGGVSYLDAAAGGPRQLFDVKLDLNHLLLDIQDVRGRVNAAFYADLFMMIASMDSSGEKMTATEVAERHEEKLLMLGPVLERQQNETTGPLIDMTFEQLMEAGALPPAPPELENQPLEVELLGILAQAQRAVQTGSIDRFIIGAGTIAQLGKPEVLDKINGDAAVEIYADSLGVDPRILRDDREVEAIRQQRAQAQAQAQQAAAAKDAADSAAQLGKVPTQGGGSNMAVDVIGAFSGYQNPQAERL